MEESSEQYYSRTWEIASKAYEKLGFYNWCIERIPNGANILEIGSGIGISTTKILDKGYKVSSLESNPLNFEKAINKVSKTEHKVNKITSIAEASKNFQESSIILCDFIIEWKDVVDKINYNTVVCWFVGVHPLAFQNPELRKLGYKTRDFSYYRDLIYNRIFQVVSLRLPVGGVISLIERIKIISPKELEEEKLDFIEYYELESFGLKLDKIEQLPIGDISKIPGIEMLLVQNGKVLNDEVKYEASLISYTITKVKEIDS